MSQIAVMRMKRDYKMVSEANPQQFAAEVTRLMNEGYDPYGQIVVLNGYLCTGMAKSEMGEDKGG